MVDTEVAFLSHYGNSLYWTVTTMTTVGYGDLFATNGVEMVYAIGVMVMGKLLFGFILGTVASTLSNLETRRMLFEDKLKILEVLLLSPLWCPVCMQHLMI